MIISLRLKNFYSFRDDAVLDFTADTSSRKRRSYLSQNLLNYNGDEFVNILGLFGSNAAGKSNVIKGVSFCRDLILTSHLNNEGDVFEFEPFKFVADRPSEFYIDFVTEGVEYEYSFTLYRDHVVREELWHYPNKRRARVFTRTESTHYIHSRGVISRPGEVEANTGSKTLFLSRASSMNRELAQKVYRFFLNEMAIGVKPIDFSKLNPAEFESFKPMLLNGLEVSDSDIVDIRLVEKAPGQLQLQTYHCENPSIPFDFEREESDGTKRLLALLMVLLKKAINKTTVFIDEFDLKLHLRLAEFILDMVRASKGGQMVFTSHNPSLLNSAMLRPEQIIFVSKGRDGNSDFAPLSDYDEIRQDTDIMKAYLQGRFDAVPYVGNPYPVLSQLLGER